MQKNTLLLLLMHYLYIRNKLLLLSVAVDIRLFIYLYRSVQMINLTSTFDYTSYLLICKFI